MDLAEKYRPHTLSEVRGNRKATEELRTWALNWPSEKKAALLYGRPGTGKTSAAISLANDLGWQLLELNASDKRTQGIINETAGAASKNVSLTNTRKLILLDEIDNLHGTSDRGGAKAVTDLVKKTREPVILTANDLYAVSSTLRGHCKQIPFFAIREESALKALLDIWQNEKRETQRAQDAVEDLISRLEEPDLVRNNITELSIVCADLEVLQHLDFDTVLFDKISAVKDAVVDLISHLEAKNAADASGLKEVTTDLDALADFFVELGMMHETLAEARHSLDAVDPTSLDLVVKNAKGDLRSAINDFQAYVGGSYRETAARDRAESTFDLMRSIFTDKDPRKPLNISYAVDETPEDLVHWIDENIPRALKSEGLAHAFQILSSADIYLGRTRKRQNYSLWKYATELMTYGVNIAARKTNRHQGAAAKYSPPTHWMRLGQTRAKRSLRDTVASKIASANHVSVARAREEILPFYKELALEDPARASAALSLDADELAFLMGVKKDAAVVKKAIEGAEQLINEQSRTHEKLESSVELSSPGPPPVSERRNDLTSKLQKRRKSIQTTADGDQNRKSGPRRGQKYLDEF